MRTGPRSSVGFGGIASDLGKLEGIARQETQAGLQV
jgi:hypothetical protein